MSMPIQRQSESFGIFDDGPRYARDRGNHDLPKGLAALINTSGPRIQAGMLNTRTASEDDVDAFSRAMGMGGGSPADHDAGDTVTGHCRGCGGEFPTKPGSKYHRAKLCKNCYGDNHTAGMHYPDEYDPRVDGYAEDFGDRPSRADFAEEDAEAERKRKYPRGQGAPWDYDKYGDPDPDLESLENTADPERFISGRRASRHPFDRAAAARLAKDGECTCWEGYERVPGTEPCASGSCRKKARTAAGLGGMFGLEYDPHGHGIDPDDFWNIKSRNGYCSICGHRRSEPSGPTCDHGDRTAAVADPAMMAAPVGGGFQAGHRVGLDWRDRTIPGTVIANDGLVHIRWDEGQYTSEDPSEVHLL